MRLPVSFPWGKRYDGIASKCTEHPETGWLPYEEWRDHIWTAHPRQAADEVDNSYRWMARRPDGSLRLGRLIRHTEDGEAFRGMAPGVAP